MSWMSAIHTDCTELVELVHEAPAGEDPGVVGTVLQEVHGWVTPTVAGLARSLITKVMERTPHDEADTAEMERVISLLGTGS